MPWTYGIHAVETVLTSEPESVQEVWLVKSRRPSAPRSRVRELAEARGVRFRLVNDQQLRGAVGDVVHQGVAARVDDFAYAEAEPLLAEPGAGMLVVLDEVQDPHNLGAVLRTARGLGARGVVIPRHRSASVTATVRKVAAGAASTLPVARVANLSRFLEDAREAGWWAYAGVAEGGAVPSSVELADRALLVLGSEQKGVRPSVLEKCDVPVTLPIEGVESLNVSVAAALLMYEWSRQRVLVST